MWKTCTKCGKVKALYMFRKDKKSFLGIRNACLDCDRAAALDRVRKAKAKDLDEWLKKNRDNKRKYRAKMTPDERREQRKGWAECRGRPCRSREEVVISAKQRKYNAKVAVLKKSIGRAVYDEWEKCQPIEFSARMVRVVRQSWAIAARVNRDRYRLKYKYINEFVVAERIRRQVNKAKKRDGIADTIRIAINRGGDSKKVSTTLGYTIKELTTHLEAMFVGDMSWDDFKRGEIHIDHIKPQSLFDLSAPEEYKKCWALSNLQPLWAKDNLSKSNKFNDIRSIAGPSTEKL